MEITLPKMLREFADEQISSGSFATLSDYLSTLVLDDLKRKTRNEIDQQLLQSLKSGPATPFTEQDWDNLRAKAEQ